MRLAFTGKLNMSATINEIRKTEILTACDHFAETVFKITLDLRTCGYTDRTLPNFPKAALLTMMGKEPAKVLRGDELDHYLYSKIINLDGVTLLTPEDQPHTSLNDLIIKLYHGYQILKRMYAKVLGCSLIYGQGLQVAFKYINDRNNRVNYRGNWQRWLTDNNIGIKVNHARMLRTLAKSFININSFTHCRFL